MFTFLGWVGKQFVTSVVDAKKETRDDAREQTRKDASARDYIEIRKAIIDEMDKRYMDVDESREKFAALESKMEQITNLLASIVSNITNAKRSTT